MNYSEFRENFKDYMLQHMEGAKLASGGRFIQCRCPICGDSIHKSSAHMYIQLPNGEEPSWYYCHKCHSSNIITYKTLLEWNIYDNQIADQIEQYNIAVANNPRAVKYFSGNRIVYLSHRYTTIDDKSEFKRRYICNRLGIDLSFEQLQSLKVQINLLDLLKENRITKFTRDHNIINDLDREFIGFISVDNNYLNMRRTCPEGKVYKTIDKRYVNYKIFDNKFDNTQRFYVVPNNVDLNTPYRTKLNISEGPFDILSVFLNVRRQENGIYSCVAGSNYITVINYFMIDMRVPNLEIHIYPDNDQYGSMEAMYNLKRKILDPTIPIYIHRNTFPNEKDFGVPLSRINETVMKLE